MDTFINILLVLLAAPINIYIFAVTLLGNTLKKAEKEEEILNATNREAINNKIDEIKSTLNSKPSESEELDLKLKEYEKQKQLNDRKIKSLRGKYSFISVNKAVLFPTLCDIVILISLNIVRYLNNQKPSIPFSFYAYTSLWLIIIICICVYVYFLGKTILLIEDISKQRNDEDQNNKLKDTIKTALSEYYASSKETTVADLNLSLEENIFPLKSNINSQLTIKGWVSILNGVRGNFFEDVEIWFYIPEGFQLVDPPEKDSWRQSSNFLLGAVRTVKKKLNTVSIGPRTFTKIVLTTPGETGEYKLYYRIIAKGYFSKIQSIPITIN